MFFFCRGKCIAPEAEKEADSSKIVQNIQKNRRGKKKKRLLQTVKNLVIHILKARKYGKMELYTELSTLSTGINTVYIGNFMETIGTDVL